MDRDNATGYSAIRPSDPPMNPVVPVDPWADEREQINLHAHDGAEDLRPYILRLIAKVQAVTNEAAEREIKALWEVLLGYKKWEDDVILDNMYQDGTLSDEFIIIPQYVKALLRLQAERDAVMNIERRNDG